MCRSMCYLLKTKSHNRIVPCILGAAVVVPLVRAESEIFDIQEGGIQCARKAELVYCQIE